MRAAVDPSGVSRVFHDYGHISRLASGHGSRDSVRDTGGIGSGTSHCPATVNDQFIGTAVMALLLAARSAVERTSIGADVVRQLSPMTTVSCTIALTAVVRKTAPAWLGLNHTVRSSAPTFVPGRSPTLPPTGTHLVTSIVEIKITATASAVATGTAGRVITSSF